MKSIFSTVSILLTLTGALSISEASLVLVQNPGSNHFAFEAEHFSQSVDTGTPWFQVVDESTISPGPLPGGSNNGSAVWVSGVNVGSPDTGGGGANSAERIEYNLLFQQAGTYKLYAHGYVPNGGAGYAEGNPAGNNDSIWEMTSFGSDPGSDSSYNLTPFGHPVGSSNNWNWVNRNSTIVVTPGQVGVPIPWAWAMREDGAILDRFVFSTNTSLSGAALDAIPSVVPEPSTALGLLALGTGAFLRRRRRILAR